MSQSKGMGQREQFESLMELAEFHLSRWRTKNATEWRVAFAVWAVLLASPIYVRNRPPEILLAVTLAAFAFLYCYFWAFSIARKNHFEVYRAFEYKNAAQGVLSGKPIPGSVGDRQWNELSAEEAKGFTRAVAQSPAFWFQVATTIAISVLAFVMIGQVAPILPSG